MIIGISMYVDVHCTLSIELLIYIIVYIPLSLDRLTRLLN